MTPLHLFDRTGYDGHFEENITVSVESYIGEPGAKNGVKLEEMVPITTSGTELIAKFPFELPAVEHLGLLAVDLQVFETFIVATQTHRTTFEF